MDVYSFVSQYRVKLWDALEGCAQTGIKKKTIKNRKQKFFWIKLIIVHDKLQ